MANKTKDFIIKQKKLLKEMESGRFSDIAINAIHSQQKNRIFGQGNNSAGSGIGQYSTKATLAGASSFVTKKGFKKFAGSKRKRKKLKWVTVNSNALFVVKGGYKAIREADGRQTSFVNLVRTAQLQKGYILKRISKNNWQAIVTRDEDAEKIEGNEGRFGTIFNLTAQEKNDLVRISEEELAKLIKQIK